MSDKLIKVGNDIAPVDDFSKLLSEVLDADKSKGEGELAIRVEGERSLLDGVDFDSENPSLSVRLPIVGVTMTWSMSIFGKTVL